MVALVGAATYYTATVIVKVLVAATGKGKRGRNRAELNYDALGQAAFGRPGQLLSGGVQIAELSLASVAAYASMGLERSPPPRPPPRNGSQRSHDRRSLPPPPSPTAWPP